MIYHNSSISFVDSSQITGLGGCSPWADVNYHAWLPGRTLEEHGHPWLQYILVLRGQLEVDWGCGWRTVIPGEVHILPPGRRHRLRSPLGHGQFGVNCTVHPDERGLLDALLSTARPEVRTWPEGVAAARRIHGMHAATPTERLAIAGELDRAALALTTGGERPIDRLAGWLAARIGQAIDVAATARALGTTRSRLQAACRIRHGCGVAHLHERLRLEAAAGVLLGEPDLSQAEVAAGAGYPDTSAFSRAFQRVYGQPPGAWRRRHGTG